MRTVHAERFFEAFQAVTLLCFMGSLLLGWAVSLSEVYLPGLVRDGRLIAMQHSVLRTE
jgi:hypothetical protein